MVEKTDLKKKNQVTIGVFGLHPCAGATHLSVLLAVYFSHYKKKKALLIEESGKNALRYFEIFLYGEETAAEEFRSRRCRYRKNCGSGRKSTAEEKAEYAIYDLGCDFTAAAGSLMSCDFKWIIGSGGIFRADDWKQFLEKREVREQMLLQGTGKWYFLQNHTRTGEKSTAFSKQNGWKRRLIIYGLGAEENLLHPSKEAISLFSKMEI